ncbi:hypothetical protein EDC01DRAFT_6535 [Geopyxis carbonaria]|nr:hypothetical protein EDC01DRAFT_6535 [Geopyxis carbonaria]
MRVVELVIDGFKSYAQRTVINDWDESFNAITGLNGSGKSNVLDAICFVLGIQNMSIVRAANLQDLIYKRGQAGITKASVTIVFDNSDKERSPMIYRKFPQISVARQIVLGGSSKYLINGVRAQQQTVFNFFQGVGLNINNPNFVIMQGRITKVLNMKPKEILALLEEAAGTRMFDERREKAVRTIEKKDKKVEELSGLLHEEILPKLERLRNERRAFLEFQQAQSDMERFTKLVVAHDFVKNNEKLQHSVADLEKMKQRVVEIDESTKRLQKEIDYIAEDSKRVRGERDEELRKGGRFQALEAESKQISHDIVRIETQLGLRLPGIEQSQDELKKLEKALKLCETVVSEKNAIYYNVKEHYDAAKKEIDALSAEHDQHDELLQTLSTGISSREGQQSGYQNQLQDVRNKISIASTEQGQAKLKISHLEQSIKEQEPRAKKARQQNETLLSDLDKLKEVAMNIQAQLDKLGFEEGKEEDLRRQEVSFEQRIRDLKGEADNLRRRVSNTDFHYSDPSPNFDRSKVKGLVAQLFTLDKSKHVAGAALEICAGGQLYNVVVDTADTASQLLQHGKLRKRVTIIPLNKINPFRASAQKVATAQSLAPGKVELALSLIGYDDDITKAMEFVFGSTLICSDSDTAKKVTFDPNVRMRSVTFEGDVYQSSGVLTGGSAPTSSGVLVTLQRLNELMREIEEESTKLRSLRELMAREKKGLDLARKLKQELELKNHEISLTQEQINSNSSSTIINAIEEMKENVAKCKQDVIEAQKRQKELEKDAKRIENDVEDFKNNKDSKLAELKTKVDKLQKNLKERSQALNTLNAEFQDAQMEAGLSL